MKLLIIDSNSAVRRVIRSIVAEAAFEILECSSAADVMALYQASMPDFAVLQMEIDGLGGIGLAKRIKGSHPDAKIILAADYDDPVLREAAKAAGAYAYVLKENLFELPALLRGL